MNKLPELTKPKPTPAERAARELAKYPTARNLRKYLKERRNAR